MYSSAGSREVTSNCRSTGSRESFYFSSLFFYFPSSSVILSPHHAGYQRSRTHHDRLSWDYRIHAQNTPRYHGSRSHGRSRAFSALESRHPFEAPEGRKNVLRVPTREYLGALSLDMQPHITYRLDPHGKSALRSRQSQSPVAFLMAS